MGGYGSHGVPPSLQFGFVVSMSAIFFFDLRHPLICFSRAIAICTSLNVS